MAKKQTRKSVSLNRLVYLEAMRAAEADGLALSEWVTRLIRERIPGLPETSHARAQPEPVDHAALKEQIRLAEQQRATAMNEAIRGTARQPPSRTEIDSAAARRRLGDIQPGTLCANCVEAVATHKGKVDNTGTLYPICDSCALPLEKGDRCG